MTISTWDGYIGSAKQPLSIVKTGARTTIAAQWFSLFELAGNPGAGTLAGTSTTTGVVPTDATAGMPIIYPDSALFLAIAADSTSSGVPELELVIANG